MPWCGLDIAEGYVVRQYSQAFRMVLFCSYLTAVIILASYFAALISSLTKPHPKLYNGIEELIDEGGYSLIVTKKTAMYQFLKDTSDETLHRLFKKYIRNRENSLPKTYSEALDRVCMDEKYVLFAYFGLVYSESSYPNCHLDDFPFNSVATPRGMIFPKTSWYKDVINYNLQKYMDYGVFDRLIAAATPRRLTVVRNPWTTVTFKMVSPVLIVLCFVCIASIVILFVEKVIAECNIAKYSKRSKT